MLNTVPMHTSVKQYFPAFFAITYVCFSETNCSHTFSDIYLFDKIVLSLIIVPEFVRPVEISFFYNSGYRTRFTLGHLMHSIKILTSV